MSKFLKHKVWKEKNFPDASIPLAELIASAMALGEFTLSRHYSSFQAKWLCKISKVTVTQNQVVLSVCQGQCKAAALKTVSCSAFNSEEPRAEPEHSWDVRVLQTVPLPSRGLWDPPTLQWETEGPGRSQLCLKEFLLLWKANTWTLLSVFSWVWITQACRAYKERKFWTEHRSNFNTYFPGIWLFSNQVWVLKCKCFQS